MSKAKFYYKNPDAPKPNKPINIGTCAIIRYQGKILFEKRVDSGVWALIGGGLEIEESLEQCIIREIREETSLTVEEKDLKFWRVYSDPSRIIEYPDGNVIRSISSVYLLELTYQHELVCSEESRALKYFTLEEIKELNIAKTHEHILKDYISQI